MDRRGRVDGLIAQGRIVRPDGGRLDPDAVPRAASGAPLLLPDTLDFDAYVADSQGMVAEYADADVAKARSLPRRIFDAIDGPFARLVDATTLRAPAAREAARRLYDDLPEDHLCVGVGGGPLRDDERLLNLNIGPFPNVEIVADAHHLPFPDGAVDRFSVEATLEHLYDHRRAVAELYRTLRPGGLVYACTPFLQAYHGYPHHYQNLTLTGQESLFRDAGFEVVESGAAIGPVTMLVDLAAVFWQSYAPKGLNVILHRLTLLFGLPFRYLDAILLRHRNAHVLSSATYVLARKPIP